MGSGWFITDHPFFRWGKTSAFPCRLLREEAVTNIRRKATPKWEAAADKVKADQDWAEE
jgi:hypothetical protein